MRWMAVSNSCVATGSVRHCEVEHTTEHCAATEGQGYGEGARLPRDHIPLLSAPVCFWTGLEGLEGLGGARGQKRGVKRERERESVCVRVNAKTAGLASLHCSNNRQARAAPSLAGGQDARYSHTASSVHTRAASLQDPRIGNRDEQRSRRRHPAGRYTDFALLPRFSGVRQATGAPLIVGELLVSHYGFGFRVNYRPLHARRHGED